MMKFNTSSKLIEINALKKELDLIIPIVNELRANLKLAQNESEKENIEMILSTKSGKEYILLKSLERKIIVYIRMLKSETDVDILQLESANKDLCETKTRIDIIDVQNKQKKPCAVNGKVSDEKMQELVALHTRDRSKKRNKQQNER